MKSGHADMERKDGRKSICSRIYIYIFTIKTLIINCTVNFQLDGTQNQQVYMGRKTSPAKIPTRDTKTITMFWTQCLTNNPVPHPIYCQKVKERKTHRTTGQTC